MGLFASKYLHAWCGAQPCGADDPSATQTRLRPRRIARGYGCLILCLWAGFAQAETIRIATYAAPLSRDGPGLLLRDIRKGEDDAISRIVQTIAGAAPDVLILTDIDYDYDSVAVAAFAELLPAPYAHVYTTTPNAGLQTGFDIDRNGYFGDARDAQGYGRFAGDGGMAVLSRFPIATPDVQGNQKLLLIR